MEHNSQITKERKKELISFQKILGIRFKRLELLNTALAHKSYVNESGLDIENNEKLEFLGDAFLGFIISNFLYNQRLYSKEGSLARIKSYVVSEPTLYRVGKKLNIQQYLLLGKGEEKSGGRERQALISDAVEAVIGAYFLDSGYKKAKKFVEKLFYEEILRVEKDQHEKDYKSILQELTQKRYRELPEYSVIDMEGPEHRKKFYVNVRIKKRVYGPGVGVSKKEAEQKAAYIALKNLKSSSSLSDTGIERIIKSQDSESAGTGKGSRNNGENA